ncbi:PhoX family protein [Streptomyces caniscabiei]|uniref:PhoX family protein n=1 Tax=Streptomyces caniscabiei TaxID=2746961 RepID=UPI0038F6E318
MPLATGNVSHVAGMTADEVYVFTRLAADRAGTTSGPPRGRRGPPDHRPRVYRLTNNSDRGAAGKTGPDEANPRIGDKHGHVLELEERRGDAATTSFAWRLMLVCGDPDDLSTYFAGFDKNQVSPISCPDNVAFDPHGNLWIARTATRWARTETCGPIITEDRIQVAAQPPGETTGATAENPGPRWPDGAGSIPRPSVVAVWKDRHR